MTQIPIACSLDAGTQRSRSEEWRELLTHNLVDRAPVPAGVRVVLRHSPRSTAELKRLIELEKDCCSWIDWAVEESHDCVEVEATAGRDEGVAVLRDWFLT